jgi:hypothetical protein
MIKVLRMHVWKQNNETYQILVKGGTRKNNRGSEIDQSTLYACMEILQRNGFV